MAAVPINIKGRQPDASLVDDLATMLEELYADVDGVMNSPNTHAMLSDTHNDSTEATVVRGDLIVAQGSAPVTWQRLAIGSNGTFLKSDGSDASWAAIQETDITDGTLLARLAANETISGTWTFNANPILANGVYLQMNLAGGNIRLITGTGGDVRIGDPVANNNSTISFYTTITRRMQITSSAIEAGAGIVFRAANGANSAPAYSNTSDTNTGMYFDGSDNLFFSTNSVERVRITNTGLGVGLVSPSVALDVRAAGHAATSTLGVRYVNDTAATSGVARQFSPAVVYSGTGWDTSAGGSSKTVRIRWDMRPTTGAGVSSALVLSQDPGTGTFSDSLIMGAPASGESFRLGISDGNLVFKNSSRGIVFTANPLTDTTPTSHFIQAATTGRIDLTPLVGGSEGFVNVDHNQFGTATGTIPAMNLRGFDNSTSTPIPELRMSSVPGGTAAAGFGGSIWFRASSNTTTNQDQGYFDCVWGDATHATRSGDFVMRLTHSAAAVAEKFRFRSSGLLTFGGITASQPALKPNSTVLETKLADDSAYAQHKALEYMMANATYLMRNAVAWTNNAGVAVGTLNNAPAAGDPTKWIRIDDNGTPRYIPAW